MLIRRTLPSNAKALEVRHAGLFGRLAAQQRCLLTVRHIANYRRVKSTFEAIFEQHLPDIIGLGEVRSA